MEVAAVEMTTMAAASVTAVATSPVTAAPRVCNAGSGGKHYRQQERREYFDVF